ncbi:MAG: hypothetical protein K2L07_10065 [Lachnospiraceae bacterium]|nr:hypothetical protein [Lachnospiraceae bacterium]
MTSFKIILKNVKDEAENFEDISKKLEKHYDSINGIKGNLTNVLGSACDSINSTLDIVMEQIQKEQQNCMAINKSLGDIVQTYKDTEKGLIPNYTLKSIVELGVGAEKQIQNDFGGYFKDNFWSSFRDSVIEGSGKTVVRIGGLINVVTATARSAHTTNGFVVLNPNVIPTTSKMISVGSKVATAAKYGLPVIGGIIDYACMRAEGQDVKDSLIKATAHVGIGLAGAAIGAAVGSVVPGVGNVVGAAIGFVAGVAITTVGSITFDYVYDNWDDIKETAKEVGDNIVETAKDIEKTIEKGAKGIINGIGNAVSSTGKLWGTVFG